MSYSCSEKLWKPIIRPPRDYYQLKDLGNYIKMVMDTVTKRTDFEIVNKRKLTLQCRIDLSGSGHSEGVYISLGYYESQEFN